MSQVQVIYRNEFGEQIPMKPVIERLLQRFDLSDTSLAFYDKLDDVHEFESWLISNRISANDGSQSVEKRYLDLYHKLKEYQKKSKPKSDSKKESKKDIKVEPKVDKTIEVSNVEDELNDVVDDKPFSIKDTIMPIDLKRFLNGNLGINYRLKSTNYRTVKPLDSIIQSQREFFKNQFSDIEYVQDLIDNLSYTSLVDAYTIYTQGCMELISCDVYKGWCVARAFKTSSIKLVETLDDVINIESLVKSAKFPNDVRWFLFLSVHEPTILTQYDNKRIIKNQEKLNDDMLLVQALIASILSVDDEDTWNDALIGDQTKRYRNLIQRARTDILGPYKTYQRTQQTKHRFKTE